MENIYYLALSKVCRSHSSNTNILLGLKGAFMAPIYQNSSQQAAPRRPPYPPAWAWVVVVVLPVLASPRGAMAPPAVKAHKHLCLGGCDPVASSPSQSRRTGPQEQARPQNQSTSELGACLFPPHLIKTAVCVSSRAGDGKAWRTITPSTCFHGQTLVL